VNCAHETVLVAF